MVTSRATLIELFLLFLKIGLMSVGGGLSAWIYREVVTRRNWLSPEEFFAGSALATIMPGANVSNLAVFVGNRLRGTVGAATCLFGLLVGPFFAVIALYLAYDSVAETAWAQDAINGVAAAAMGLLLVFGAASLMQASGRVSTLVSLLLTFIAVGLLQWPMLPVVGAVGAFSIAAAWRRNRPLE